MDELERVNVLGVGLSAINLQSATHFVFQALKEKQKGYICVTGVHGVSEAQTDKAFKEILNNAFLNTPDGMPMSWMGWAQGNKKIDRVYGPDLMLKVCERSVSEGVTHFFYGGKEGVAEQLKEKLQAKFPGLKVLGTYCPPFRALNLEEERNLLDEVASLKPDIIWVGLSTPKQENFMNAYLPKLDTTLMFGVGAAFDFHAGLLPQAPPFLQRAGLEWFFRLCKEPKRLWKRYLKNNPLFILRALLQLSSIKKYRLK